MIAFEPLPAVVWELVFIMYIVFASAIYMLLDYVHVHAMDIAYVM